MEFFVPGVSEAGRGEQVYADLAKACDRAVPASHRRVCAVTFMHDGFEYEATVGQRMEATEHRRTASESIDSSRSPRRFRSGNTVMAIFAGDPYVLWQVGDEGPSTWNNPAMIGAPQSVRYFGAG